MGKRIESYILFSPEEMRTTIKSLSIGIDQLTKKMHRDTLSSKHRDGIQAEWRILLDVKQRLEKSMLDYVDSD